MSALSARLLVSILAGAALVGCAGVKTSNYAYNDSYKPNQPTKSDGCYDASVLLTKDVGQTKMIAKKALAAVDSTIE